MSGRLGRKTKTFLLAGPQDKELSQTDILAINRDLETLFGAIQDLDNRPRIVTLDPQNATASLRPKAVVPELLYYNGKLYFCTNATTPTFEKITSV